LASAKWDGFLEGPTGLDHLTDVHHDPQLQARWGSCGQVSGRPARRSLTSRGCRCALAL